MITLDLPFPVSTNALYRVMRGTPRISPAYRAWTREADALFLTQKRKTGRIRGRFSAFITLDETRPRKLDTDNAAKCVLDAMQRWGVIENDNLCGEVHVRWGYAPEGCRVALYPYQPQNRAGLGGTNVDASAAPLEAWTGRR